MTTLLLPFIASLLFVAASLFVKRAADLGVGVWRMSLVTNLATAAMFLPLWFAGGNFPGASALWQPALAALIYVSGQLLMFLALEKGDVSIATPVLGTKILIVAVFQSLLTEDQIPPVLWLAAILATGAVALLQSSASDRGQRVGFTIGVSFACGTAYALFDVLVQLWSPTWGIGRFLPWLFIFVAIYSVAFIPLFEAPLRQITRPVWRSLGPGAFLMGAQSIGIVCAIALFGRATEMNVIYAARGFWAVIAVWLVGHWFENREGELGSKVLMRRLAGAMLLLLAILLVLGTKSGG